MVPSFIGVVMLTSTPSLAAQALRSLRLAAGPTNVAVIGLGLWEVDLDDFTSAPWTIEDVDALEAFTVGARFKAFNFSKLNNLLARSLEEKAGPLDFLLFLNDDTHTPDGSLWLSRMVEAHREANASAVGLKLVYPDGTPHAGTIQHAGHNRGPEGTGVHRGLFGDPNAPPFTTPAWIETWAVTGACVLVRPADFWKVGGFDEAYSTVWQDVDLSLSLRQETGRPVICVQDEWIYHFEGATQGGRFDEHPWWEASPNVGPDRDRFLERWPPWKDAWCG